MIKQFYIITAMALVAAGANAQQTGTSGTQQGQQSQQELHKEITLEKDFVPVEKKATKKNNLPTVKKAAAPAKTTVNYSDWAKPIDVPTTIPTMMPYGYRTAHNFSNKRGYLDLGGGMAANFVGSAGYRIIDKENLTLGIWAQHASTWTAKNSTKLITDDALRYKQQFNDNAFGLDLMSRLRNGTLTVGARGHIDSFNYYGNNDPSLGIRYVTLDSMQLFSEFGLNGTWEGLATLSDRELSYNIGAAFNHAGYDKTRPYGNYLGGDKENLLNITVGGEYALNEQTRVGIEFAGDYVNHRNADFTDAEMNRIHRNNDNYFLTTISPYVRWENHTVRLNVGADLLLGNLHMRDFKDLDESSRFIESESGRRFYISPNVQLEATFTDGAAFYVDLSGGKTLNTLSNLAIANRYSDPNALNIYNSFSPFDGEAGFKIGPFAGFSAKVFGGYGFFLGDLNAVLTKFLVFSSGGFSSNPNGMRRMAFSTYATFKFRGMKVGGELNYKYRSLIDAKANLVYAPAGDNISRNGWNKGYSFDGTDGASLIANFDVKVTPIRQLSVELGLQVRSQRSVLEANPAYDNQWGPEIVALNNYSYFDLDDVLNLHAGASWKFDKTLTLWVKGNNLLNRRWDVMPGMGAQKLNIMGGFALVF